VIPMARLPAHSPASRTRRQRELLELAEITSSDVVFWDGGPRAPPTHQPQPDPDTNQDSEVREALSPSLSPNHTRSRGASLRRDGIPNGMGAGACSCLKGLKIEGLQSTTPLHPCLSLARRDIPLPVENL
jgi:hypothetical protein